MNAKVHYSWLGTDSKKTYLVLSLSNGDTPKKDKSDVLLEKYCARIAGFIAALYFTNNEAAHILMTAFAKLFAP